MVSARIDRNEEPAIIAYSEISISIWTQSYNAIKHREPELVDAFERILAGFMILERDKSKRGREQDSIVVNNELSGINDNSLIHLMNEMVEKALLKTQETEGQREKTLVGVDIVLTIRAAISPLLEQCTFAGLAVSGICAVLPVSFIFHFSQFIEVTAAVRQWRSN